MHVIQSSLAFHVTDSATQQTVASDFERYFADENITDYIIEKRHLCTDDTDTLYVIVHTSKPGAVLVFASQHLGHDFFL